MADQDQLRLQMEMEAEEEATGEPGQPGHDPYKAGPTAHQPPAPITPRGGALDAVKSFANKASLGAGPQIAGAMGALANAATQGFQEKPTSDLDAYRYVRDETARDLAGSENTLLGQAVTPIATLATPIPIKQLGPTATAAQRAIQGVKVGAGTGILHGATTSQGDLTKFDRGDLKKVLTDALLGGALGGIGGGAAGGVLGKASPKLRSVAETQALKAAGLRGGITNQVQKRLGLSTEQEARELGRKFLDEDLIPFAGSKESVAKRAESLQQQAGQSKAAVLDEAEMSGTPFDYASFAKAARDRVASESAVATQLSGQKASALEKAFEAQGKQTPGSFIGADKAKSDAWKSARFDDEAPMAAQLYRKATGAARDDISRQVESALGKDKAGQLADANAKYGVAADALKLARNAGTRDQANSSLGLREQLMLAAGVGGGVGGGIGHGIEGLGVGLGGALLANVTRKRGNAAAARFADYLSNRSGGVTGGAAANALSPYLELLKKDEEEP